MKLQYLAHAAFLMTSERGTSVLTDPYEHGSFGGNIRYDPIVEKADVITISHSHQDHNYIAPHHAKSVIIKQEGQRDFQDISIRGIEAFHDNKEGKERGKVIINIFTIDNIVICHVGDLGQILNSKQVATIGVIDVLMIPVGGIYTIDAAGATKVMELLAPKICIPMHYKTPKLGFELHGVDKFIAGKSNVKHITDKEVILEKSLLPKNTEIWVMKPSK